MMRAPNSILTDSLVSTAWLQAHLTAPSLRVVDIRGYVRTTDLGAGRQEADYVGARDEYEAAHIPGAVYVDWTTDITDPKSSVKAQIAPPDRFGAAMAERGIGDETDVVVVDHTGGHFATRLWWSLRFYGHDAVAILDGGYARWIAEGWPVTSDVPRVKRGTFSPRMNPDLRVAADDVLQHVERGDALIVDARDEEQYRGDIRRGPRGGHIPGAVNLPAKALFGSDGSWHPVGELRRLLKDRGIDGAKPVVAYCNGGVTATAVLFAMDRAGFGRWANYDGSWNEWGGRADYPVEMASGRGGK
ncbi:MAG TPA: sulfurtransferase [Thermomicrobiales bacterium]|nr:sulfurtransferase [Thermomicrobiales bacterium]